MIFFFVFGIIFGIGIGLLFEFNVINVKKDVVVSFCLLVIKCFLMIFINIFMEDVLIYVI